MCRARDKIQNSKTVKYNDEWQHTTFKYIIRYNNYVNIYLKIFENYRFEQKCQLHIYSMRWR